MKEENEMSQWVHGSMGVYRSGTQIKELDDYFNLEVRRTNLVDFLKEGQGKQPKVVNGKPVLADLSDYISIQNLRSARYTQLIGYDAEWTGAPRKILSYQFATVYKGDLWEFIIYPLKDRRLTLEMGLGTVLDQLEFNKYGRRILEGHKIKATSVTLACHAGTGDLTAFTDNPVLRQCESIERMCVTMEPIDMRIRSYSGYINNPRYYKISLNIADSMCHAVGESKSLDSLGLVINVHKMEIFGEMKKEIISLIEGGQYE